MDTLTLVHIWYISSIFVIYIYSQHHIHTGSLNNWDEWVYTSDLERVKRLWLSVEVQRAQAMLFSLVLFFSESVFTISKVPSCPAFPLVHLLKEEAKRENKKREGPWAVPPADLSPDRPGSTQLAQCRTLVPYVCVCVCVCVYLSLLSPSTATHTYT